MDKNIKFITDILPRPLKESILSYMKAGRQISEIRLRAGFAPKICIDGRFEEIKTDPLTSDELLKIFKYFCQQTLSVYEDEIAQGYITLEGGNRVGIGGRYFTDAGGKTSLAALTSLNIRISGATRFEISPQLLSFSKGMLVVGKPHSGKTTFLKSLCHKSEGENIAVCDERQELFSPLLDCDFICGVPKRQAIRHATRSLNPDIIICDEIGREEESRRILSSVNSGVRFVCTCHGQTYEEIKNKPSVSVLINAGVFDEIVFLDRQENKYFIKEVLYV